MSLTYNPLIPLGFESVKDSINEVGLIFTESWANLSSWTNVGTPTASVSGGKVSFAGTASATTNYIRCSGYGKFNFENTTFSFPITVGTIGASTSGIGFGLQSQSTLGGAYQNSVFAHVELSTTSKGCIRWYLNNALVQTSTGSLTTMVTGDILNCTLRVYPDKYVFSYNINGGRYFEDTYYLWTGPGFNSVQVAYNAANFAVFNLGQGATKHQLGTITATCHQIKGADLIFVGNSIPMGYSNNYFYNRAITQVQKRAQAILDVYARPSNSVNDLNVTEIGLLNPVKILLMACSNDIITNGATTTSTDLGTLVTSLGALVTSNAPSGYSVARGNLIFCTEFSRAGNAAIATYNTSLVSTYGMANIIDMFNLAYDGTTSLPYQLSFDGIHPNDDLNSKMADKIIDFFSYTRKDTYTNNEFFPASVPGNPNGNVGLGNEIYLTNFNGYKILYHNAHYTGGTFKARGTQAVGFGIDPTAGTGGAGIWVNTGLTPGSTFTAVKAFGITYAGGITVLATNTAAGTTGNQTIDKPSGTVNIAAGGSSVVVTNALVTANSIVIATIRTNDSTAIIKNVVPAAGSFTIRTTAAVTAETSIGFLVIN